MKKMSALLTLISAMLISLVAQSAATAELSVKGIVRPTACTPILGNGGVVDHGNIDATELSSTQANILREGTVSFKVNCSGPTLLAVRLTDNKADSVVPGLMDALNSGTGDHHAYGLGFVNGQKIGVYSVVVLQNSFNGTDPDGQLARAYPVSGNASNGTGWNLDPYFSSNGPDGWKAFTTMSPGLTNTPAAWSSVHGTLSVSTVLDKGANLPLSEEIELSGSATLEVMYL